MMVLRTRACLSLLVAAIILFVTSSNAAPQRAMPAANLAYPVLIIGATGDTGSGFCLNTPDAVYLVTAKHVLYNLQTNKLIDKELQILIYAQELNSPPVTLTLDMSTLEANGSIKAHSSADVAVIKILTQGVPPNSNRATPVAGVTPVKGGPPELTLVGVSLDAIKTFDDVLVGNDVVVFGYPTSLHLEALPELDIRRPLLRKGIVAGVNPATRSIILDSAVYFGNSGGLVMEIDHEQFTTFYRIIGVVNKYVPFAEGTRTFAIATNSGYSIATPMDFVLELIK